MAITSWPFETQDTTETQFSQLFRELQDSGVVDSATGNGFKVQAATGLTVDVLAGDAIVRGFMVSSDATVNKAVAAPHATLTRKDRVVLRLDPTANTITVEVLTGTPASSPTVPALTQTSTANYEIALATLTVNPGAGTIASGDIIDERPFVGSRVGVWRTATRPASPRLARLGYNLDLSIFEVWTGSTWANVIPSTVDNSTRWGGYTVTVSTTTPGGSPTADRIWIQPTS
jgi:hypothetical protein